MGRRSNFAICFIAAILLYKESPVFLFWAAAAVAIINFLSWGIMHNFHLRLRRDPEATPDWVAVINILSTIAGLGLLIQALIIKF